MSDNILKGAGRDVKTAKRVAKAKPYKAPKATKIPTQVHKGIKALSTAEKGATRMARFKDFGKVAAKGVEKLFKGSGAPTKIATGAASRVAAPMALASTAMWAGAKVGKVLGEVMKAKTAFKQARSAQATHRQKNKEFRKVITKK